MLGSVDKPLATQPFRHRRANLFPTQSSSPISTTSFNSYEEEEGLESDRVPSYYYEDQASVYSEDQEKDIISYEFEDQSSVYSEEEEEREKEEDITEVPIFFRQEDSSDSQGAIREMSARQQYRGVEYSLSPTLPSPTISSPFAQRYDNYASSMRTSPAPFSPQQPSFQHAYTPVQNHHHLPSPLSPQQPSRQQFYASKPPSPRSPLQPSYQHVYTPTMRHVPSPLSLHTKAPPVRPAVHFPTQLAYQHRSLPVPPSPSSTAPAHMTVLLQDVLGIMNTIMEQQAELEEESTTLKELVELVVIMQEEAEALVELADLVEEFVEEVDAEVGEVDLGGLGDWVEELGGRQVFDVGNEPRISLHEREDSGVGLSTDEESVSTDAEGSSDTSSDLSLRGSLEEMRPDDGDEVLSEQFAPPKEVSKPPSPVRRGPPMLRSVSRKGLTKAVPQFRDSALGLVSPAGLPRGKSRDVVM